jgi:hypothetical protein
MDLTTILFVSGITNIILLILTVILIYITLRVMLILGPREAKKSMMFPILVAGILLLPMAGTELYRNSWTMLIIFHSISMLLVVIVLTFGVYRYYRMLKKAYAWESETKNH